MTNHEDLTAAIERLRKKANDGRSIWQSDQDVIDVIEAYERLRAEEQRLTAFTVEVIRDRDHWHSAWADLRAEREALHSDEMREQVARIVRDFMQTAGARITTSDRILAARVLSVLSSASEATR